MYIQNECCCCVSGVCKFFFRNVTISGILSSHKICFEFDFFFLVVQFRKWLLSANVARIIFMPVQIWAGPLVWQFVSDTLPEMLL